MKVRPMCSACILLTRAKELEQLAGVGVEDALAGFRTITESVGVYLGPDIELSLLATASFRKLKKLLGDEDIYSTVREKLEPAVRKAVEGLRKHYEKLEGRERFAFAVKVAAAGNALDPARPYLDPYVHDVNSVTRIEMKRNDMLEIYEQLVNGAISTVAYVFDNSLEAYYDTLLIRELQEHGASVTGIVKSSKFEDDLTLEEARRYGIDNILDDIVETGSDAASLIVDEVTDQAWSTVNNVDLVIVKGPLNYLHFRNNRVKPRTYAILRVPCKLLAKELGVTIGSYIAIRV